MVPVVLLVAVVVVSLATAPAVVADEAAHYNPGACQKSSFRCGDAVDVRYPFFLDNATYVVEGDTAYAKSYCGYPGMAIACDGGRATLKLSRDNYTVLNIDYVNHTVTVADADVLASGGDCPRVTHSVTVPPETWLNLSATANDNLTFFYDCVFTAETTPPPPAAALSPINCSSFRNPSGAMSFVVVQADMRTQDEWPRACKPPVVVPVLRDRLLSSDQDYYSRLNSDGYGQLLKMGFQLTWDPTAGPCYFCEESKGQCSYNQVGEFIGCLCSNGRVRRPDCGKQVSRPALSTVTS